MKEYLTFDDVALKPQYNNVPSRTDPILNTWLTTTIKLGCPILASNMDTVISDKLADVLIENGSYPIFHRFTDYETQLNWVNKYKDKCFISCGLTKIEQTCQLLNAGAVGVCIDIAHGHSESMITFIKDLKQLCPYKQIIAGNICTAQGYQDLVNAGADAVKIGIGPGAACSTRMVTGFGCPQFTAIRECAKIARKLKVPLIADGGIRNSRDVVLALAAGASSVMIGSLFAKTIESAADKYEKDGVVYSSYQGQASKKFQNQYYGKIKKGTVAEGVHFDTKCTGSAQNLIDELQGGLRSALTYGGSRDIKELQTKSQFIKVTSNYITESKPRSNQ
jgi:IMP dehydrogenase